MFKSEKVNNKIVANNLNSPDKLNRIVENTSIEGKIDSNSNIRVDGYVKGTITTKGRIVLGTTGKIDGDVICQNADIEGSLTGTISVKGLLSLKTTAKLKGDIITNKLSIEPGAVFAGTCSMGGVLKNISDNNNSKESHTSELKEQTA